MRDFYSLSFDLDVFVFSDGIVKLGAELGEEILHLDFIFEEGFLNEPLNLDRAARLHGGLLQGLSALWLIGGRSAGVFLDGADCALEYAAEFVHGLDDMSEAGLCGGDEAKLVELP